MSAMQALGTDYPISLIPAGPMADGGHLSASVPNDESEESKFLRHGNAYGNIYASGSAVVVVGNVTCRHLRRTAPEDSDEPAYECLTPFTRSANSSQLPSSAFSSRPLQGNGDGPTSEISHEPRLPEERQDWHRTIPSDIPCDIRLRIGEGGKGGKTSTEKLSTCLINIAATSVDFTPKMTRAIVVFPSRQDSETGHRRYWIPVTNIKVVRSTTSVVAEFSNCTQRHNRGKNYHNDYQAIYNPMTPNVRIEFIFRDEKPTKQFCSALLQPYEFVSNLPGLPERLSFLPHSRIEIYSPDTDEDKPFPYILVWSYSKDRDTGQETGALDLGRCSPRLTFDMREFDDHFSLELQHLKKIKYTPVNVEGAAFWPPPKVEEHNDGAPESVVFDSNAEDDKLVLKAPLSKGLELLQGVIGHVTQHHAKRYFFVEYAFRSSKHSRSFAGQEGQLTVWSREQMSRVLLRATTRDPKSPRWSTWIVGPPSCPDGTRSESQLESNGDVTIILEDVDVVYCDCLSMGLQPHTNDISDVAKTPEPTTITLGFRSQEEKNDFVRILP